MGSSDEENLLPSSGRDHVGSPTISFRFSSPNHLNHRSPLRRNILLLLISLLLATCLSIYIYLNYIAINGTGGSSNIGESAAQSDRYKPLSRRKPILDHESIFSESGPSLLKLSDLVAHCIVALRIGGQKVVDLSLKNNDRLEQIGSKGKTEEGVDDVVTGADLQSHQAILNTIKDSYRRLKIVSEEDTTSAFENLKIEDDILPIDRGEFARMLRENIHQIESEHGSNWPLINQQETLVWIDPLDATKEYSENLTEYVTLMACIVHRNRPIAGIIYKPFLNETFWSIRAESGRKIVDSPDLIKAWSHRKPANYNTNDSRVKIIVSRSHSGNVASFLDKIYDKKVEIISSGGSGYKTMELIKGTVDAYVHVTHIKKWDICAPHAILHSYPNGRMTDLGGNAILFGNASEKVVTHGLIASLQQNIQNDLLASFKNYKLQ